MTSNFQPLAVLLFLYCVNLTPGVFSFYCDRSNFSYNISIMDAETVQIDIELAQGEVRVALEKCIKAESRQLVDPLHEIGICNINQIPQLRGIYR